MWRTDWIAYYKIHVIQNSKMLVLLHYSVKDQPDWACQGAGVTLLSDSVKEKRSTIWRCHMKSYLASKVELLAEVMKEKLWGKILKLPPKYMKSLNDNSINSTGNHSVRKCVSSSRYEKHWFSRRHFHCWNTGGKMITMKKHTRYLEKCEKKLLFSFCYSSNSVTWM